MKRNIFEFEFFH